ncbi:hypothetical protein [Paenibacillus graminis]|uniref:hypothetical protein n=1 Tax=Paenibacillus graminis TaxID=189425 RepID=UPI002DBEFAEB|nr:hypothetical protein [Paenibacillus graminis]MEC0173035.1 hypothetical protein [Paenibacillus graminis]
MLKEGANLNTVEDEIVQLMIRHGVMYSEVQQVLENVKEKTFNSVVLKESFDAPFEEEVTLTAQDIAVLKKIAQMKNNQSFVTLTPSVNLKF